VQVLSRFDQNKTKWEEAGKHYRGVKLGARGLKSTHNFFSPLGFFFSVPLAPPTNF